MASPLRYTLVSDGPTDRALLPIIDWVLLALPSIEERGIEPRWADLRNLDRGAGLAGKVAQALHHYPCDVLFVHRDAESSEPAVRRHRLEEIRRAMPPHTVPCIPIVPVRMTEAWLLIDRQAICRAADNPASRADLSLPPLRRLEQESDPKELLHELLIAASEFTGRRRDKIRGELSWRRVRVAEYIDDFSPLRRLAAFTAFEEEARRVVEQLPEEE